MQTLATITFQNYFRLYDKIAGMTGTALTEAGEFHKIYGLDVVAIPDEPSHRRGQTTSTSIYRTDKEKWTAIATRSRRSTSAASRSWWARSRIENQ